MKIRYRCSALLLAAALSAGAQAASQQPVNIYRNECGSCHVAYPADFLPAKSWQQLLGSLDKHFGDSADLLPDDLKTIERYLSRHNYDHSRVKRRYGKRFDTTGTPLRVTRTRFFRAIHHEIPSRLVEGNPKVKTYARCQVCHFGAARGSFGEEGVRIPR